MPVALHTLEVLAVDCQATAAFPRGELLEVGWARASAARTPAEIESHVVSPRGPVRLSRRLRELTGLTGRDLRDGITRKQLAARLAEVVGRASRRPAPLVGVAHFARFEAPFLRDLLSPGVTLELLCTHEMARRLLPDLPRRGLRAVAGYLGHGVPEPRRAGPHVAATLLVWRDLVSLLDDQHGIRDLDALRRWLQSPSPRRRGRVYPMEARTRLELPDAPGVYRFQRSDGSVLYVGKATSLRQRVNTYFQTRGHGDRTLEMLAQARAVDVSPTVSAVEAALLEPDEIKRLGPPYNVAFREKGRRLAYWSWSLREAAPRPDERHPVGPFLFQGPRPPVSALLRLLDRGGETRAAERWAPCVLGVPRRHAPASGVFRAGLQLFVVRHGRWWSRRSAVRCLTWLGARLRRRPGSPSSSGDATTVEDRWTPETVANALEDVVRRGVHALRRARWLVALSECSVAWEMGDAPETRCLVVSGGVVVSRQKLSSLMEVPLPPGHSHSRRDRQERLDLAAYDRLSVLSRELKALVAAGRPTQLRLGPQARLDAGRLGPALRCL